MASKRDIRKYLLEPVVGSRFQPTGFPDLGAATYDGPGGDTRLLVESVQSLANHLEGTTWDEAAQQPVSTVEAIPYVRVVDADGGFLTSSRLEAHRLASAYVLDAKDGGVEFRKTLVERFGLVKNKPLDLRKVYSEIYALDPLSLLHGVFFAQGSWPWQPKISRAVSAFIEAEGVNSAVSGGVKKDSVNNNLDKDAGRTSDRGYGMVPHHRTEYTADKITLFVVIDEQQIHSYGLPESATELLLALADWEVATLLDGGLRLRTACDFEVIGVDGAGELPDIEASEKRLTEAITAADLGAVTELVWTGSKG
ncbi:CRISPR-associated protein, GSU0053 family [Gordonia polyisoprenivorans VH2]|uniref:CRISPR-associated protein, GSU0053 family n=1 Tax=Gordonia polyisoprenivorans (strain DSM 44266 / VH2) TaxID=1112204 RepID=H6N103_GORPV|nr:type I-U CRISPR-associated RAMP protein Csb1/Cas7u [Gordonia polyisoprenivorans]AFA74566.1 CRISPR-associated protein, GSU0053 family [Gordonia polyisoprenivorans VH2]